MDQSLLTTADLSVLHDSELYLVAVDRAAGKLRLGFRTVDGIAQLISFYGVLTLRIDNTQYQNVASRVILSNAGVSSTEELERIVRWSCSGSTDDLLISEQNLQRHLSGVRSGKLRLFYVEPSWGAEIGVIAEGFFLSEG